MSPRDAPIFLILMADQLAPSALPFYGNRITKAPTMSWPAGDGVVFDHAYTASPCAPALASLMTGLLPSRLHVYDNAAGDWKGDLILGSTESGSAIGTLVERATGFVMLLHVPAITPPTR